ncbi:MAG: hypothetical protein L0H53_03175 [Candidatus Nitrosocosmicus sp.]|nr:hypothetical protein [Candidatus Nitrosocosmicus sp.]MDN5868138.1 hypothetical protein [Candidatus Nitrosocosmicus sp.]
MNSKITDTANKAKIVTDYVIIHVTVSPDRGLVDLDERATYVQKGMQEEGVGLVQTTQLILVDNEIGYHFMVSPPDSYMVSNFIYVSHNDKLYEFHLFYGMEFAIDDYEIVNHIIDSIRLFD